MKKTLLMAAVLGTISSPVWAATGTVLGGADAATDVSKLTTVQTMEYVLNGAHTTQSITQVSGSAVESTTMAGKGAKTLAMVLTDGRIAAGTGGIYDTASTYVDDDGNKQTAYISPVVSQVTYDSNTKKGTINVLGQNISGVDVAKMNSKLAFANMSNYASPGLSDSVSYQFLNDDIIQTALNAHATAVNALADAAAKLDDRVTDVETNGSGGKSSWKYTDADGNPVKQGTDGKYYKESDLDASGAPNTGATAVETKDIVNSAVNVDGTTTNPTVIGNVADAVKATDAVNKGQMDKAITDAATKAKTTVTAGDNVTVTPSTNADGSSDYKVAVNKDLTGLTSVEVTNNGVTTRTDENGVFVTDGNVGAIYNQNGVNVSDGTKDTVVGPGGMVVSDGTNTATYDANGIKAGDTKVTNEGLTIGDINITKDGGINAGNKTITNVADAVSATDAVNKGQMDKAIASSKVTLTDGDNITVTPTANADGSLNYEVALAKDLTGLNSVTVENGGIKTVTDGSGVTVSNGTKSTTYGPDGVKAGDVTISSGGINAGNTVISNVADGVNPGDAVNRKQLDAVSNGTRKLSNRLDKVGAGAAALAALHPLDFNPDDKWNFALGYGNYAGENAMALGAFYQPNEDIQFNVAGTLGNGENMVNAGVSFKLGQSSGVTNSRVAMAQEIKNLKNSVDLLMKQNQVLANTVSEMSGKQIVSDGDFSDVPMDHWAYGYVKSLAQQGVIEGYPDGMFKGDLAMTRYEFAALLYRALQAGATIDSDMKRAIDEFKPQLERVRLADTFRIDRVSGKDNDRHKVDRVRVNGQKGRDVYGNHITTK